MSYKFPVMSYEYLNMEFIIDICHMRNAYDWAFFNTEFLTQNEDKGMQFALLCQKCFSSKCLIG
jgi:hypothetical protein